MNSNQRPITVLVPVYNAESSIPVGMKSILAMARAEDEILVIDDGSSDKSLMELQKFSKVDNRINLISRGHQGLVDVLNFGLTESANELIARADIDDSYHPDRLNRQVGTISESPHISAVFSDYEITNVGGNNLGVIPSAVTENLTKLSLINHQRTAHPSVLFSKEAVISAGGYIQSDFPAEDYALWVRLSRISKLRTVPQVLLCYTLSPTGISRTRAEEMKKRTSFLQAEVARSLDVDQYRVSLLQDLSELNTTALSAERKLLTIRDFIILLKLRGHSLIDITRDVSKFRAELELMASLRGVIKLESDRRKRVQERD